MLIKTKLKEAWKTINNLLGKKTKQTIVNELDMNKNILQDPQEIVEGFNEYFSISDLIWQAILPWQIAILKPMYKKQSQSLLHFNLPL